MKIECGEYVRTKAGHFYKITRIDENGLIYWNKIQCGWSEQQLEDIIVKHSKQLIDLIEVGDYVNGYKVSDKESTLLITNVKGIDRSGYHIPISQYGDGIKSIVTKEQFASMEYKLEG